MTRTLRRLVPVLALAVAFALATAAPAAEAKGKIKSVNADKSEFVMTDDTGKERHLQRRQGLQGPAER